MKSERLRPLATAQGRFVSVFFDDSRDTADAVIRIEAGSENNYHGEFAADVDQADKHLTKAQELIDKALTHSL